MTSSSEKWVAGDAYEHFMGRWSREVAKNFIAQVNPEIGLKWLDIGCGTGALTHSILSAVSCQSVIGIDPSVNFLSYASQSIKDASFVACDARSLALKHNEFDRVVSGLALNFVPNPEKAVSEWKRVAKSGGIIASYVWDYSDKMEFLRYFWDCAVELDANAKTFHEGYRFPLCNADALEQLWQATNLQNISVSPIDIPTVFQNFEEYWNMFTMGNFPAPQYVLSLSEQSQQQLKDLLRSRVPQTENEKIQLIARAWMVRGSKKS